MKLIFFICGIALISYPLVTDMENMIIAGLLVIMGSALLGGLREEPHIKHKHRGSIHFFEQEKNK